MNINLDIKEEQLAHLDGDLREFFANLTDDQKLTIISTYFANKIDKIEGSYVGYDDYKDKQWRELSSFLREGIKDKVQQAVAEKVVLNDDLNALVDEMVEKIKPKLEDMIGKAVSTYIIQHLFVDKRILGELLENAVLDHIYKDHYGS